MARGRGETPIEAARRAAAQAARGVLADYPHLSTPARLRADGVLEDIAYDRGARVELGALGGADGRLVCAAGRAVIRVRATDDPARRAFTIAHELGHLVLGHGVGGVVALCTDADAESTRSRTDEAAAHAFAAELLMPETLAGPLCARTTIDLTVADDLSAAFRTSVVASARRMVELASVACAVVYSQHGRVTWARRSRTFRGFVRTGYPVPGSGPTAECASGCAVDVGPAAVPANQWDPHAVPGEVVIEHARLLDPGGAVLTVLATSANPSVR